MGKWAAISMASAAAIGGAGLMAATPANAAIQLCYETGNDIPQCAATTSNVNVDNVTGTPVGGVSTVGGHLNDDPAQLLTFTSMTETLVGDGSGQAVVSSLDGLLNGDVTFALTDATFNLATFNLSPLGGNASNKATSVQVTYIPTFGGSPITYTLNTNGNNFYGIYGSDGEQIQSITFGGYLPEGSGIADIRQVRLAGVQPLTGAVPEPSTWAMLLVGFGAVGASLRRRKSSPRLRLRVA